MQFLQRSILTAAAFVVLAAPASSQGTPQPVLTASAPAAVGPYSQAVSVGPFVFLSGQIGLDPASTPNQLVSGGVEPEARQAMLNLRAVLAAAGLGFANVVKTTIYVTDIADFTKVNSIYGEFFSTGTRPARATVGVAALPRGAHVEIEAIAVKP